MKLYCYYDKEADVLYFSSGKPSAKTINFETSEDVLLRRDPKNKKIKGFTILNFCGRMKRSGKPLALPIEVSLHAA